MKKLVVLLLLLPLLLQAQNLTADDMLNLSLCTKPLCYVPLMKERGFKLLPDTISPDTLRNKSYHYVSKKNIDRHKHKNKAVFFVYNNARYTAVIFTTKVEKTYRQLLNNFYRTGFMGGQKQYGQFEEKATYRSDYYPGVDLLLIQSKDFTGTKILRYDFVLTRVM